MDDLLERLDELESELDAGLAADLAEIMDDLPPEVALNTGSPVGTATIAS